MYQNGYSVFVVDHQGQGKSTRLISNPHIGYVSEFADYIEDLHALINHVFDAILQESKQNTLPKYLLCHSMGGAIGTGFVQKYPEVFSKLVLSAPMFGINAPLPESLMKFILRIVLRIRAIFKLSTRYVWGQSDYQAYPFEKNRLTNSKERYTAFKQIYAEDPSLQLGGPSFEWLSQAVIFMQKIRQNMASIKIPVCAFIAEEEQIVDNNEIQKAVSAVANYQLHYIENAKHEILFEQDKPRNQTLNTIFDFFRQ